MSLPDAAAAAVDPAAEQPRRVLGIRHGIAMCAGMVIGSGIFKSTPMVAASISSPSGLLLVGLIADARTTYAVAREGACWARSTRGTARAASPPPRC